MSRPRLALLFLCALLTVELTLHNHSLIPGDGNSATSAAQQQATCPACATTSGNLTPDAPRVEAPVPVTYTLAVDAVPVPTHGEPLSLPSRAPPQA